MSYTVQVIRACITFLLFFLPQGHGLTLLPPINIGTQSAPQNFYSASIFNATNFGITSVLYPYSASWRSIHRPDLDRTVAFAKHLLSPRPPHTRTTYFSASSYLDYGNGTVERSSVRLVAKDGVQIRGALPQQWRPLYNNETALGIDVMNFVIQQNVSGEPLIDHAWQMGYLDRERGKNVWVGWLIVERDPVDSETTRPDGGLLVNLGSASVTTPALDATV
ncbi:MAG: hypothetical protein OHK93_002037 [Ramalina farinacea]|uniref:Uncharacterized protein n=1 Tax=Ramalina farinacea TaxID=258253 RepID=A0AA43U006_9LECA|nr:hypothetical protein [Ramalina farinacea]